MRSLIISLIILTQFHVHAQPYNRLIKLNLGMSGEHIDHIAIKNSINDTGAVKLDFLSWSPTISYSHEIIFGQVLSLSGAVGFQYLNLYYGPKHYGAPYFYASINPQVSLFYRKGFEFYVKLKVGATFYIHDPDVIPEPARRLLPGDVNIFTGVTLGGFNYFITDRLGLNLELSIWSPEIATFGLSYRFFRGELPEIENENKDINYE